MSWFSCWRSKSGSFDCIRQVCLDVWARRWKSQLVREAEEEGEEQLDSFEGVLQLLQEDVGVPTLQHLSRRGEYRDGNQNSTVGDCKGDDDDYEHDDDDADGDAPGRQEQVSAWWQPHRSHPREPSPCCQMINFLFFILNYHCKKIIIVIAHPPLSQPGQQLVSQLGRAENIALLNILTMFQCWTCNRQHRMFLGLASSSTWPGANPPAAEVLNMDLIIDWQSLSQMWSTRRTFEQSVPSSLGCH